MTGPGATMMPRARGNPTAALRRYGVVVALVVLLAILGVASPNFFRPTNFANILAQWAPVGIMSVGTTYVILAGGFDLFVAAGFAFCAVIAAALAQAGVPASLAFLAAIAAGVLIGFVNALLVVVLRINPFVATLASGFVLNSLPYLIVPSPFIEVDQPGFDVLGTGAWHGVPYTGLILIGFLVVSGTILAKTQYGHLLYAVGGNAEISRLFGIPVRLVVSSTYVFSGLCVGTRHHWRRRSSATPRPIRIRCWCLTSSSPLSWAARRWPEASDQCGRRLSGWPFSPFCKMGSTCSISAPSTNTSSRGVSSSARSVSMSGYGGCPASGCGKRRL